jgi:hypothetical protein
MAFTIEIAAAAVHNKRYLKYTVPTSLVSGADSLMALG